MNYRHAYHAGNFADAMKHALLVALLNTLKRKPAGFCVLDTHAGLGTYDLSSEEAQRTGEWQTGIGQLLTTTAPALTPYLALMRDHGAPAHYPGSPAITAALLRPQDRLIACELHPEDVQSLRRLFRNRAEVAVHHRDGYEAIRALLPPRDHKRGLILIDPPFEQPDEFARTIQAATLAKSRFPTAIIAIWYPIKHRTPVRAFHDGIATSGLRNVIAAELTLRPPLDPTRLNGCGLLIVSPPYGFEQDATTILAAMSPHFGPDAEATLIRIVEE